MQIIIYKYLPLENQQYPILGLYFIRFSSENKYESKAHTLRSRVFPQLQWKSIKATEKAPLFTCSEYSHSFFSKKTFWNLRNCESEWHICIVAVIHIVKDTNSRRNEVFITLWSVRSQSCHVMRRFRFIFLFQIFLFRIIFEILCEF